MTNQNEPASTQFQQGMGVLLVGLGALGFGACELSTFLKGNEPIPGEVPAISLFMFIMGLAFFFPSMLRDGSSSDSGVSTMRVVVLLLISVFALLCIRNGWGNDKFTLDVYWVWIVAIAVGGKAGQSAVERLGAKLPVQDNP
jgi:predicted MFS family arabinose efflux permease